MPTSLSPNPNADPLIGRVLDGRFELVEFIARGGMGQVYRATQRPLDRIVAIKLLSNVGASKEEFRKRFFLEASLCARLSHPHIVRIFDFGCDEDDTFYIAMEFVNGETLHRRLRRDGPLDPTLAVGLLKQLCGALAEVHGQGMVHRDLKTSNLMLTSHALQRDVVKLVDFGIAKEMTTDVALTSAGALLGSPAFMSPEQINNVEVDARSDLYSLGVIFFQMLTGTRPFTEKSPMKILLSHLDKAPPRMSEVCARPIPELLETVVQTCLKKSRNDRYDSIYDLLDALESFAPEPPARRPTDPLEHPVASPLKELTPDELAARTEQETQAYSPGSSGAIEPVSLGEEESSSLGSTMLQRLEEVELTGYVGFIDLNCPFCFALHERMTLWGLIDSIDWQMVEHSTHVVDGPFSIEDEQSLAKEVFAVHHRAPDIDLSLPSRRCCAKVANRLLVLIEREFADQLSSFRGRLYHALWRDGLDLGDVEVLKSLLEQADLPPVLLEMCDRDPPEIASWQSDWEGGDFDCCIPIITHPASGRVLIGLATQRTLIEFLLQERSRVVDSTVCYYQQKPVVMICGRTTRLWPLLRDIRDSCEIIQVATAQSALDRLGESALPNLLLLESEHLESSEIESLGLRASSVSVHWALATQNPNSETEVQALSMGAAEYLPFDGDATVARARLSRILRDRFSADRVQQEQDTDTLTRLASRRRFIEILEEEWERGMRSQGLISIILIDIDAFKAFNDLHGYMGGNQALVQVARLLRAQILRPGDTLARFGGNEFAVLLPATDRRMAEAIAESLSLAVREAAIEHGADAVNPILTISTGTACVCAEPASSVHELYDQAVTDLIRSRAG